MSTLRTINIANQGGTKSAPAADIIDGYSKAWVNFNGTGTVAIRKAFNVSSITDNGTGDYTVNFTNPFPDANYTMSLSADGPCSNSFTTAAPTTTQARLGTFTTGFANADRAYVQAAFFD